MNENTSTLSCNAIHPNGCVCTLEASHDGPHKAFGIPGQPPYVTWPSDHQPPPRTEDEWAASMRYANEHEGEIEPGSTGCNSRCTVNPDGSCTSRNGNYFCTLPIGHSGSHIACDFNEHNLAVWPAN